LCVILEKYTCSINKKTETMGQCHKKKENIENENTISVSSTLSLNNSLSMMEPYKPNGSDIDQHDKCASIYSIFLQEQKKNIL
jgi:hypothetical protein